MGSKTISGFSKLNKVGKIKWIAETFFKDPEAVIKELKSYWYANEEKQRVLDGFSENTLSNFPMPFGVAPNFMINGKAFTIPMVIEESSVVAAAASAAKYWMTRGGFKTEVLGTTKIGQLHFKWFGDFSKLTSLTSAFRVYLEKHTDDLVVNMRNRGGGLTNLYFKDFDDQIPGVRQLILEFETCDSMGANFINTVLERSSDILYNFILDQESFLPHEKDYDKIMAILSNYTPECLVRASVSCPVSELGNFGPITGEKLAEKFKDAVDIARIDPYRACTHNKGIYNGIDAVVLATGNDFRAIESCGHTYACRDGQYRSLSFCEIKDGVFNFWMDIPMAVGTVGGLTNLHPIAKRSLEMLGNPGSEELMQIIAATGLAQNFAAVKSLVTTGIQKGHMKMHLMNILNHLNANEQEMNLAIKHFEKNRISFSEVRTYLESKRVNLV
ncbi:hydroxymethylglutaryl-CoA reductase, degradative [Portibacter lacus]|uniref:3-hydroxy-3-methylglutaryl coenzyme A reductase n=1 Tax=Portibacter lacus TaxID=1099794 RepID=A0AA37STE7_9BACT|nr:hydroxymethylglutaryl-CoA reductase, degradative [Portibacter lacus]GLR17810.1 3-hydroxy-3-methylglutaryl coenzyme A reductase [Portibacter lacus]